MPCSAAIRLPQQGLPRRLQGLELGVVLEPAHDRLLQIQGPGGLEAHGFGGHQRDLKRHVEPVAELTLAAELQGLGLAEPGPALLQVRLSPQQIEPRHQAGLLQGTHLIAHRPVAVHHSGADAPQLIGQLQAVVGLAGAELQLAQAVAVALAGGLELLVGLGDRRAPLGADQRPVQRQSGGAETGVGLDQVPAISLDQEGRADGIQPVLFGNPW